MPRAPHQVDYGEQPEGELRVAAGQLCLATTFSGRLSHAKPPLWEAGCSSRDLRVLRLGGASTRLRYESVSHGKLGRWGRWASQTSVGIVGRIEYSDYRILADREQGDFHAEADG